MKAMSLSPLTAPLAKEKALVKVGSKILYSDMCNFTKYTVTAVDSEKFSATDEDGEICTDLYFVNLQYGWELLESE